MHFESLLEFSILNVALYEGEICFKQFSKLVYKIFPIIFSLSTIPINHISLISTHIRKRKINFIFFRKWENIMFYYGEIILDFLNCEIVFPSLKNPRHIRF